jgi:PKD repeat protein
MRNLYAGLRSALIVAVLAALAAIVGCVGGSSVDVDETVTPSVTADTVYYDVVAGYKPAGDRSTIDDSSSHRLRPTWNVGGTLITNLPADQGKVFEIPVKNRVGELTVGYYTDMALRDTLGAIRWVQLDREQAAQRPVLAYITEVGTFADAVTYSYNGSEELTGATVSWIPQLPFDTKIPFRNRVDATPAGLGEVAVRLLNIVLSGGFIERTITIHEKSDNWLMAGIVAIAGVIVEAAMVVAPVVCPGEENNSWIIFRDIGGNNVTTATLDVTGTISARVETVVTFNVWSDCPEGWSGHGQSGHGNGTFSLTMPDSNLTVTIKDGCGNTDSHTVQLIVTPPPANKPPVADLQVSPTSGYSPLTVTLDASASYDTDGTIVTYEWDFGGDGTWDTTTTVASTTHTYAAGTRTPKVRVTDNDGATDIAIAQSSIVVTVAPPVNLPPHAVLVADPTSGYSPMAVSLDASNSYDTDGNIVTYEWDFEGNGSWAIGATVTEHVYHVGTWTPNVRVTDDDGATSIAAAQTSIVVTEEPVDPYEGAQLSITPLDPFADPYVGDEITLVCRMYAADGLTELTVPTQATVSWNSNPNGFVYQLPENRFRSIFYSAFALDGDGNLLYASVPVTCNVGWDVSHQLTKQVTVYFVDDGKGVSGIGHRWHVVVD